MKLILHILLLLIIPNTVFSQLQMVNIDQCRDSAKINWPNFKKIALQNKNAEVIIDALNKNYLPKLTISGSATYQSEVVIFPEINIPGMTDFFPTFPNDNYRTDLQLLQIIYDGGNTKSAKNLQLAANSLEETQTEIENYNLMDQINKLYLNILLLKKNYNILITAQSEIIENIKILQSAYSNGAVLVSELNKLIAEQLKIEKQLLDTEATRLNIINSLSVLTELDMSTSTVFQIPEKQTYASAIIPQLKIFTAQEIINQASLEMEFRNKFPKLSLFAKGGYGRPGYNFMDTDLHPYGMVGINLSWNIIDWGTYNKQKEKSIIKQKTIAVNKQIFVKQNNLEIEKLKIDLMNIKSQIEIDNKIISIKEEIKNSSWSKFKNGTITSNDYLKDFNELKIAQQTLEINKIRFIQNEISLNHMEGVEY